MNETKTKYSIKLQCWSRMVGGRGQWGKARGQAGGAVSVIPVSKMKNIMCRKSDLNS